MNFVPDPNKTPFENSRELIRQQDAELLNPQPPPAPPKLTDDHRRRLCDKRTKLIVGLDNLSAHDARAAKFQLRLPAAQDRLAEQERTTDPDAPREQMLDFAVEKLRVQFLLSSLVNASQQREELERAILAALAQLDHLVRELAPESTLRTAPFMCGHPVSVRVQLALAAIEQFLK